MKWEKNIIAFIKEKALEIPEIQETFMHPAGMDIIEYENGEPVYKGTRIKKYPALVFTKESFDQEFFDTGTNEISLNFLGWIVIGAENIDNTLLFEEVLPNVTDAVISKFNKAWDFGTLNGSRIWARMASGRQGYTAEESGRQAWVELALRVRTTLPTDD